MISYLILYITRFFGVYLTDVICGLIYILAIYWFCRYDIGELVWLTGSLRKVNGKLNAIGKMQPDKFETVNMMFEGRVHPALSKAWNDYCNDLERLPVTERSPDCRIYFSINTVITIPTCRKKVAAVPGILTAMGVLGAMLIFISGIGNTDAAALAQKSTALLQGILTEAASALVIAIATALIFRLFDSRFNYQAERELNTFNKLLEQKILDRNMPRHLEVLVRSLRQQTEYLHSMGDVIGTRLGSLVDGRIIPELHKSLDESTKSIIEPFVRNMEEVVNRLSDFTQKANAEGIQKMADCFINQLNASTEGQLKRFGSSIHDLCESQRRTKEDLDLLIQELVKNVSNEKEINQSSVAIVKTIALYHQQILSSNRELTDSIEEIGLLAEMLSSITSMGENMLGRFSEQKLNLQAENEEFLENMGKQTMKIREDLKKETEDILTRFTDITTSTFDRMEGSLGGVLDRFTGNAGQILEHMETQVEAVSVSVREVADRLGELNGSLERSVKDFNAQVYSGVEKTFDDFDRELGKICGILSQTITEIKDSVDELPVVIEAFRDNIRSA